MCKQIVTLDSYTLARLEVLSFIAELDAKILADAAGTIGKITGKHHIEDMQEFRNIVSRILEQINEETKRNYHLRNRANTRLIAHAPEMYDMLLECAEFLEGSSMLQCEGCSEYAGELYARIETLLLKVESMETEND